jgi:DNA-binding NarL/FixJ family response regulator
MIRILVADDHIVVREGVKQILSNLEDIVVEDEAGDGQEALEKALRGDFDVILLDISMPGRGGLETLEDILKHKPRLPVLILSMHPEEQYAVRALSFRCVGIPYQGQCSPGAHRCHQDGGAGGQVRHCVPCRKTGLRTRFKLDEVAA